MKRISCLLLAALLMLTVVGCTGGNEDGDKTPDNVSTTTSSAGADVTDPTGDTSDTEGDGSTTDTTDTVTGDSTTDDSTTGSAVDVDPTGTTDDTIEPTAGTGSNKTTVNNPNKTTGKTTGKTTKKTTKKTSSKVTKTTKKTNGIVAPTTTRPVVHATLPKFNIKGKTVEFLSTDSPESDASKELVRRFKEAYGADLKITYTNWNNMQTQLNVRVMNGNPPDVTTVRNADYFTYQTSGILKDISGKIDYDSALWKDIKAATEDMQMSDKQYYAVIDRMVYWYIWYNKSIMLDNGIVDTPDKLYDEGKWTVSAMRDLAKELTIRDGEQILTYGLGSNYGTLANSLEVARGARQVVRKGTKFTNNIDDPKLADAFNFMFDLYAMDKCMAPIDQEEDMFAKGRCAMLLHGSFLTDQRTFKAMKQKGTIGVVPFPKWDGEREYQSGEYTALGIPRNASNIDLGLAYINFARYLAIDADQLKKNREHKKTAYAWTDKELDYVDRAAQYSVVGSWLGVPTPYYLIAMDLAYGNSWAHLKEKYGPDMQKAVDELNASVK